MSAPLALVDPSGTPNRLINDRFRIIKQIGKGGWGIVYKGMDDTTGGVVAIKQVKLAGIPKEELNGMMNEITLLQNLKHKNIVRYIDSEKTETEFYIILEFVENGSLSDVLKDFGAGGRFPEHLIVLYMEQVLHGLDYLHSQGVIHRDIKGANILSTKDGVIKVADFGVATRSGNDAQSVIGTPYWMAPEIIELAGACTKSDIWSLGCTVIELLTGKPPYFDLNQMTALFRIVQDEMPPLPDSSPNSIDFLRQCFTKEPTFRKSAKDLLKHRWITKKGVTTPQATDGVLWNKRREEEEEKIKAKPSHALPKKPEPKKPEPEKKKSEVKKQEVSPKSSDKKHKEDKKAAHKKSRTKGRATKSTHKKFDSYKPKEKEKDKHDKTHSLHKSKEKPKKTLSVPTSSLPDKSEESDSGEWGTNASKRSTLKVPLQNSGAKSQDSDDWDSPKPKLEKTPPPTSGSDSDWDTPSGPVQLPPALEKESSDSDDWDNPPPKVVAQSSKNLKIMSGSDSKSKPAKEESSDDWNESPKSKNQLAPPKIAKDSSNSWELSSDDNSAGVTPSKGGSLQSLRAALVGLDFGDLSDTDDKDITPPKKEPTKIDSAPKGNDILSKFREKASDSDSDDEIDMGSIKSLDLLTVRGHAAPADAGWSSSTSSEEDDQSDEAQFDKDIAKNHMIKISEEVDSTLERILEGTKDSQSTQTVIDSCQVLLKIFSDPLYAEQKNRFKGDGVMALLEMLEVATQETLPHIFELVFEIIQNEKEAQQAFRMMGAIPTIIQFWGQIPGHTENYETKVREYAVYVIQNMYQTRGEEFLNDFVSNRALPAIRGLLEPTDDYSTNKKACLFGIDMISAVLNMKLTHGRVFKKTYSRYWARTSLFPSLTRTLANIMADEDEKIREHYSLKISETMVEFSRTDGFVRTKLSEALAPLFSVWEKLPSKPLLNILKALKDISQEPATLDLLLKVGAIKCIVSLLSSKATNEYVTPMHTPYLMQTLYQLCRLSPQRQEAAVRCGMIPHLKDFIDENSTCKQFALPVLFEIAHSTSLRPFLWENDMDNYYIQLFQQDAWEEPAVGAIAVWLQSEPAVLKTLVKPDNIKRFCNAFTKVMSGAAQGAEQMEAFSSSFLAIVQSKEVVDGLIDANFIPSLTAVLSSSPPLVRVNLVKVLTNLYQFTTEKEALVHKYNLVHIVKKLEDDNAVLVVELAKKLLASFGTPASGKKQRKTKK